MNVFKLDQSTLRLGWGGDNRYWFSMKDYKVADVSVLAELDRTEQDSQTAYFVSLGYIPYFFVSNEEVIRAFVNTVENKKLKEAIHKSKDENYTDTFWKYYKIYPQIAEGFNAFEDKYILKKAVEWCEENSITYVIDESLE